MLPGKREFLAGFMVAALAGSVAFQPSAIKASAYSTSSPEIVFSRQIGLFDQYEFSRSELNRNISEVAFQNSLGKVLADTGFIAGFDRDELVRNGIISCWQPKAVITRQAACETILRTILHGWNTDRLPKPQDLTSGRHFRDWRPEAKYGQALDYAMLTGVVLGGANGRFRPNDNLKLKEAMWFFKRLHDLISKDGILNKFALFTDVPQDHFMTLPLQNLNNAGAFDQTNLGRRLNGTGNIKLQDLGLIIKGILFRLDQSGHYQQIDEIIGRYGQAHPTSRAQLAQVLAVLANAMPHFQSDQKHLYSDVKADSEVAGSLQILAKAGIRLGYKNNLFAGNERVTRYEALGVINDLIDKIDMTAAKNAQSNQSLSATDTDIESLISRLRSKRDRVRRILNRE